MKFTFCFKSKLDQAFARTATRALIASSILAIGLSATAQETARKSGYDWTPRLQQSSNDLSWADLNVKMDMRCAPTFPICPPSYYCYINVCVPY